MSFLRLSKSTPNLHQQSSITLREYDGQPWGFPAQPAPVPVKTRAHGYGCGFSRERVTGLLKPMGFKTRLAGLCFGRTHMIFFGNIEYLIVSTVLYTR